MKCDKYKNYNFETQNYKVVVEECLLKSFTNGETKKVILININHNDGIHYDGIICLNEKDVKTQIKKLKKDLD